MGCKLTMKKALSLSLSLSDSDSVTLKPHRFLLVLSLALILASASFLFVPQAQANTIGRAVYAWGQGDSGQLGDNLSQNHHVPTGIPQLTSLHAERGIVRIYSGLEHNIAITTDNSVFVWGRGDFGQLGNGGTTNVPVPTLNTQLTELNTTYGIAQIHTGQQHNIAVLENGAIYVWGHNAGGQLGNNGTADVLVPTPHTQLNNLDATRGIAEIHVGAHHNIVILNDGAIYAWGLGANYRLGNTSMADVLAPTLHTQLTNLNNTRGINQLHIGGAWAFAFTDDGAVFGWGQSTRGDLGNGSAVQVVEPVEIPQLTALYNNPGIERFYTSNAASLLVTSNGRAYTWGGNIHGSAGNGTAGVGTDVLEPTEVPALTALFAQGLTRAYVMQHVGSWIFFADDGAVYIWGLGSYGRHGNNSTADVPAPEEVPAVSELSRAGASFFMGGRFVIAFDPVEPILVGLRKTLQMPEGTTPPTTATFDFQFTPVGDVNLGSGMTSRPTSDFPALSQNPVPVTLTGVDAVTANTVTMVSTLSLMDIFGTLVFPGGGVFVWNVHEVEGSS